MPKVHPQPAAKEPASKLRRLPSVYSRVLELPLPRNDTVHVYFGPAADYYVVPRGAAGLHPGAVKVRMVTLERYGMTRVVVHTGPGEPDLEDDLVYDKWRGPLAETAIPSMTVAGYIDGQLVVIVPKGEVVNDKGNDGGEPMIPSVPNVVVVGGGGGGGKRGLCGGASLASTE